MTIDLAALEAAPLHQEPFPYLIAPGFIPPAALAAIDRDFPKIDRPGSFPPDELEGGPAYEQLIEEFCGDAVREAIARRFGLDLSGRPVLCTVRTRTRAKDGQIHRDSTFKLVTLLLYLNTDWSEDSGRLRLLRSKDDIEDYVAEVPPLGGTLLVFKCTENAWHGHKSFAGPRRAIQLNYVTDEEVLRKELGRHRFSAKVKKLGRLLGVG